MKKLSYVFIGAWLCTVVTLYGQIPAGSTPINGSPYMDDAYVDGVIFYANKSLKSPIRYNIYQDVVEYKQNNVAMVLDASAAVSKVRFGTVTLVPQKYETGGKLKAGYFQVLDSGKVTLYSKKQTLFFPYKKGGALDGTDQAAEYKRQSDVYYYKASDGALHALESIKSMIASLPDKQEELTLFAKKEKISARKEKEVIELVRYYNSLAAKD